MYVTRTRLQNHGHQMAVWLSTIWNSSSIYYSDTLSGPDYEKIHQLSYNRCDIYQLRQTHLDPDV